MSECPNCGYDYPDGCDVTCDYKHPIEEWISIKDSLPKREDNVLIIDTAKDVYVGYLSEYSDTFYCYCNCRDGSDIRNPTHWMHLPDEPKKQDI